MMVDTHYVLYDLIYQGLCNNSRFVAAEKKQDAWQSIESPEFLAKVQAFAVALYKSGIQKQDKVALHSENSINWLIADLAITSIGAITVPIYTSQSPEHIEYILEHSEAKALIVSCETLVKSYYNSPILYKLLSKISFNPISGFEAYNDWLKKGYQILDQEPDLFNELKSKVDPDDLVTIAYTSGTTGTPKGVMLSHRNLAHAIQVPLQRTFLYPNLDLLKDTVLSFLPFTHVFEHCAIYGYLALGLPVYIVAQLDDLQSTLAHTKPVHFTSVPRLLEKIYQGIMVKIQAEKGLKGFLARKAIQKISEYQFHQKPSLLYQLYDWLIFKKIRQKLGGNLRGITTGGAALSSDIMHFFNAIGIPVAQGYGLTETSPGVTIYDLDNLKLHTAGKPFEGVELKIADDGEILARGENIMQGYFKAPEKTAEVIDPEGWFHTGDIGYIDPEGFLYITDRKKELFKLSTGKYIAPAPIENKLITIIGVDQAMVVGEDEKFCAALIIPSPDYDIDTVKQNVEQALKEINKSLSSWETVKKFVISPSPMTIESGELTPTMKKKRRIILEKRADDIHSMYY